MEFEWDESKRQINIAKHDIDFLEVRGMFDGRPLSTTEIEWFGERRNISTGLFDGRFCTVVWTRRGRMVRFISARRARDNEQRAYRQLYG